MFYYIDFKNLNPCMYIINIIHPYCRSVSYLCNTSGLKGVTREGGVCPHRSSWESLRKPLCPHRSTFSVQCPHRSSWESQCAHIEAPFLHSAHIEVKLFFFLWALTAIQRIICKKFLLQNFCNLLWSPLMWNKLHIALQCVLKF